MTAMSRRLPRRKHPRLMLVSVMVAVTFLLACGQTERSAEIPTLETGVASGSTPDAAKAATPTLESTVTATSAVDQFGYTAADGTVWLADARSGATRELLSAPVGICELGDCTGHDAQWSPDGRY